MATTIKDSKMQANLGIQKAMGVKPVSITKPILSTGSAVTQLTQPTSVGAIHTTDTKKEEDTLPTQTSKLSQQELEKLAIASASKLNTISTEIKSLFLEREAVVDSMFLALIAGHHILLLGPPGTGKSALTKEFTKRITNARIFEWLLNRTSDPAEILGPISIKNMERDKFVRILDNKIGDCEISFVDEIFKCNEPTLNAMLPILNERVIFNDGKPVPIALKMMVAASNEIPEEGEGLEALYDRILFKHWVDYIQDPTNRMQMMVNYNNAKNPITNNAISRTSISLHEIEVIQAYKDHVIVPMPLIKDFNKLLVSLNKKGIRFSDRKVNWCLDIIKANALFNGRTTANGTDIEPLAHVLWERPEDVQDIQLEISKVVDPYSAKIKQWSTEAVTLINDILRLYSNDPKKAMEETLEAKTKIETVINKMDKTIGDAQREGKDTTAYIELRNSVSRSSQDLMCKTLGIQPSSFISQDDDIFGI